MTLGVRSKLFLISLVLILSAGLVSSLYLEPQLREWLDIQVEEEFTAEARLLALLIEEFPSDLTIGNVDPLADSVSAAVSARVTIIRPDGTVVADSDVRRAEVGSMEDHGGRPEVLEARETGRGMSRRYSETLRTTMLYVAVPYHRAGEAGTVRIAVPLFEHQAAIGRLRRLLMAAGALGIIGAVLFSGLAAHFSSRRLRDLAETARSISRGGSRRRITARAGDELGGIAGSFNQIAEQLERTVSTLAAERNRFEAVLESMNEAVVALDEQQRVTLVNAEALRLLALEDSPVGRPLVEAIRSPGLLELVESTGDGAGSISEFELPRTPPVRVLGRAAPLRATGGTVVVLHDVTELRRLESVRREFVANVSHELRTPISIIRANSETLLDGALEDPVRGRGFAEAILRNAERLSKLVADLLDISRIESGSYEPDLTEVPLRQPVRRAVGTLSKESEERGQTLQVEVPEGLTAYADSQALDQVVLNLVENAVKYTPDGSTITVRAEGEGHAVRLEVRDDGPGVDPRHRRRLFERFYRVDEGRSRDRGGTGLGLAIVKHLTEAMGGRVGYEPAWPRGSVFWVTLPARAGR
ncbi:MAG: ATP-binding protein [bacterium]